MPCPASFIGEDIPRRVLKEDGTPPDEGVWLMWGPYGSSVELKLANDAGTYQSPTIEIQRQGAQRFRILIDGAIVYSRSEE